MASRFHESADCGITSEGRMKHFSRLEREWNDGAQGLRPLRVGVLCSRRAPGLRHLLVDDPNCGVLYEIACCLTSEDTFDEEAVAASHRIPVLRHPLRRFCEASGRRPFDLNGRAAYDTASVERLAPYRLDVIVLAGYLYALTEPMLGFFLHRIINVHHSDLAARDEHGRTRFPGLRAVRDAILAGARETRATVHLVTDQIDEGPPFLRSWAFPVAPLVRDARTWQDADMLKAYSYAHQEWMIRATWGPLVSAALELVGSGRLDLTQLAGVETGRPWDLDASGTVRGEGPFARAGAITGEIT
jgi:folate-dependent phosphoribosylglycinamide formyltransferase PurN